MDFLNAFFADTFSFSLSPAECVMVYVVSLYTLGLIIRYIVDDAHDVILSFCCLLESLLKRFHRWLSKRS